MNRADERPTVWDIRGCLLSSVDFADDFAHKHPQYAAAVTRFSQEVQMIKKELMSSFDESSPSSSLHDIVNGLTGAKAMASILAERDPEKRDALIHFQESLSHTFEAFLGRVRPHLY